MSNSNGRNIRTHQLPSHATQAMNNAETRPKRIQRDTVVFDARSLTCLKKLLSHLSPVNLLSVCAMTILFQY